MKKFTVSSFVILASSSSMFAQVISPDRVFPPAGSAWVATTPLSTTDGTTFATMEISDFQGAFAIPSNGLGGVLPPVRCSLKTRTKSNSTNERIAFNLTPTSISSGQEDYDFTVELLTDTSISNPVQFQQVAGKNYVGHVTLIKRTTGDYVVSGNMGIDLQYTEDSGATWRPLTSTANFTLQAVPEPSSLCALGFAGLAALRRKRK